MSLQLPGLARGESTALLPSQPETIIAQNQLAVDSEKLHV